MTIHLFKALGVLIAATTLSACTYNNKQFVPSPEQNIEQMRADTQRIKASEKMERAERRKEWAEEVDIKTNAIERINKSRKEDKLYIIR